MKKSRNIATAFQDCSELPPAPWSPEQLAGFTGHDLSMSEKDAEKALLDEKSATSHFVELLMGHYVEALAEGIEPGQLLSIKSSDPGAVKIAKRILAGASS